MKIKKKACSRFAQHITFNKLELFRGQTPTTEPGHRVELTPCQGPVLWLRPHLHHMAVSGAGLMSLPQRTLAPRQSPAVWELSRTLDKLGSSPGDEALHVQD